MHDVTTPIIDNRSFCDIASISMTSSLLQALPEIQTSHVATSLDRNSISKNDTSDTKTTSSHSIKSNVAVLNGSVNGPRCFLQPLPSKPQGCLEVEFSLGLDFSERNTNFESSLDKSNVITSAAASLLLTKSHEAEQRRRNEAHEVLLAAAARRRADQICQSLSTTSIDNGDGIIIQKLSPLKTPFVREVPYSLNDSSITCYSGQKLPVPTVAPPPSPYHGPHQPNQLPILDESVSTATLADAAARIILHQQQQQQERQDLKRQTLYLSKNDNSMPCSESHLNQFLISMNQNDFRKKDNIHRLAGNEQRSTVWQASGTTSCVPSISSSSILSSLQKAATTRNGRCHIIARQNCGSIRNVRSRTNHDVSKLHNRETKNVITKRFKVSKPTYR
jgi:hypothetical protein